MLRILVLTEPGDSYAVVPEASPFSVVQLANHRGKLCFEVQRRTCKQQTLNLCPDCCNMDVRTVTINTGKGLKTSSAEKFMGTPSIHCLEP